MNKRTKKSNPSNASADVEVQVQTAEAVEQGETVVETATVTPTESEADEILALMAEEEAAASGETEATEQTEDGAVVTVAVEEVELDESDIASLVADLEDATAAAPAASTKPKRTSSGKSKTTKQPAAPVVKRDISTIAQLDRATIEANIAACNAKKIVEKAENMLKAIEAKKAPSVYTQLAAKFIAEHKKVTLSELVKHYQDQHNYNPGTARSQAQQMTSLFQMFGILTKQAGSRELVVADEGLLKEVVALSA